MQPVWIVRPKKSSAARNVERGWQQCSVAHHTQRSAWRGVRRQYKQYGKAAQRRQAGLVSGPYCGIIHVR